MLPALLLAGPVQAVTVYWDADGIVNEIYGGTGTWNTTLANWGSAANGTGSDNPWSAGDTAAFLRGTDANVTVGAGGISALVLNFGANAGLFTTGSGSYTLSGGAITLTQAANNNAIIVSNGATATINNVVNFGASIRMDLTGGGTLNLNNGFNSTATATPVLFGNASSVFNIGNITRSGGTLGLTIGGNSGSSAATYNLNGTAAINGSFTINKGVVVAYTNSSFGTGSSAISLNGTAAGAESQIVLIGASGVTISRNITFASGTNSVGDTRTIGSNISSGTATFSGTITLAETNGNLRADAGGTTVFSGVITDGAETRGITKIGAGVVKLTNSNTYDGNTTVSAGTLLVNNSAGSGTGTGNISVSNGATLGGTGTVAGAITVAAGGRFSSGDMTEGVSSAGTFNGTSFTLNSDNVTESMIFDLGTDSDLLVLSGDFLKGGTGDNFIFRFEDAGGLTAGLYTLITFNDTDFSEIDFSYTGLLDGMIGNFILNDNSLQFQLSAVPEPSTYALLGLGFGALWILRRRTKAA